MTTSTLAPAIPASPNASRHASLQDLLQAMDAGADQVQRHLWLIALLEWIRGGDKSPEGPAARMEAFLSAVEAQPEVAARLHD